MTAIINPFANSAATQEVATTYLVYSSNISDDYITRVHKTGIFKKTLTPEDIYCIKQFFTIIQIPYEITKKCVHENCIIYTKTSDLSKIWDMQLDDSMVCVMCILDRPVDNKFIQIAIAATTMNIQNPSIKELDNIVDTIDENKHIFINQSKYFNNYLVQYLFELLSKENIIEYKEFCTLCKKMSLYQCILLLSNYIISKDVIDLFEEPEVFNLMNYTLETHRQVYIYLWEKLWINYSQYMTKTQQMITINKKTCEILKKLPKIDMDAYNKNMYISNIIYNNVPKDDICGYVAESSNKKEIIEWCFEYGTIMSRILHLSSTGIVPQYYDRKEGTDELAVLTNLILFGDIVHIPFNTLAYNDLINGQYKVDVNFLCVLQTFNEFLFNMDGLINLATLSNIGDEEIREPQIVFTKNVSIIINIGYYNNLLATDMDHSNILAMLYDAYKNVKSTYDYGLCVDIYNYINQSHIDSILENVSIENVKIQLVNKTDFDAYEDFSCLDCSDLYTSDYKIYEKIEMTYKVDDLKYCNKLTVYPVIEKNIKTHILSDKFSTNRVFYDGQTIFMSPNVLDTLCKGYAHIDTDETSYITGEELENKLKIGYNYYLDKKNVQGGNIVIEEFKALDTKFDTQLLIDLLRYIVVD